MLTDPALTDLRTLFGDRMSVSPASLAEHAQSESLVTAGLPDAVVFPHQADEVAAAIATLVRVDGGEDLVAVVTALGLEKPALLGHSMGAATVAHAAGLRPELFSCVILEDPPWRDDWSAIRQQPQTPAPDWQALSIEQIGAAGRAQSPLWHPDEFPAWAESKRQFRGPADWRARAIPGIVDWRETVAAIGVPALLLRGGSSERGAIVSAEIAAEAQRLNSRVQTACFAQAGHNVRREAFAPYVAAVSSFLARY